MKDQPWYLNQTWPVGQKCCQFINAPQILRALPKFGRQKNQIFDHFFTTFAFNTTYLQNETSH